MVNYLAVLVATIASFVIGGLWYGPLFGKHWMRLTKLTKKDAQKGNVKLSYILGFISSLVTAYVLAFLISLTDVLGALGGAIVAFWVWLGFVATFQLSQVLWEMKPFQLWMLNNAYNLLMLLVMGAIIGAW